ncbi:MAG: PAS domain S-box protein [Salinirussus sp.]
MDQGAQDVRDQITVLHIDDDADFLNVAVKFLERADGRLAVETATSVEDAEHRLTEADIDCVVSDYQMPDGTGLELLRALRSEDDDSPFILFTGRGSESVASEAISAGVTDYLQKGGGTDQYTVLANRIVNAVEAYRSEQALEDRSRELQRYERMVNSMGEAACIYDQEGRFDLVNDYLADWYGTTPAALVGQESALIPHIRNEANGDPFAELLAGKRAEVTGELEAEFPNHGYAVLAYRLTPLYVDGDIDGVVGVARDITDRRERELALEESSARLQALFDHSPDMINVHDLDGTIIDPNPRLCEETGYDRSELEGMKVWDLDEAIDPDEAHALWDGMAIGDRERIQGRYCRRDGSTFEVEVHIRRLNLAGRECFIAISRKLSDEDAV